jgi:uncharacterized protein (TIGR03000 family)
LLVAGILPVLGAEPDAPPRVRTDRSRPRLAARGNWTVVKNLYTPNDAAEAARQDLRNLVISRLPGYAHIFVAAPDKADQILAEFQSKYAKTFCYYRYLTSYNFPEAMREGVWQDVSFLVNSLSRHDEKFRPAFGGPGNILIRINLLDYDIDPEDWDKLVLNEPYFHQDILPIAVSSVAATSPEEVQPGTINEGTPHATIKVLTTPDADIRLDDQIVQSRGAERTLVTPPLLAGKRFRYTVTAVWHEGDNDRTATKRIQVIAGHTTVVDLRVPRELPETLTTVTGAPTRAMAGWINPCTNSELAFLTHSQAPIARADWFIANASVPPNYYDLLRLKTLDDFRDLAGFDKRAEQRKEIRATVVRSGSHGLATPVARNNRILARTPTFQGYFWETFDFLNSVKARNVINNFLNIREDIARHFEVGELSGLNPREWLQHVRNKRGFRDAGEWIACLPNGLQFYFLTNGQDQRLDEADIHVAYDSTAHDFRVINGRSCIWCHSDGIRPFRSQFQLQIGPKQLTDLGIYLNDPVRAQELSDFIRRKFGSPQFETVIQRDQAFYSENIAAANTLTPESNAALFRSLWDGYQEVDLNLNVICYELGIQPEEVKALIAARLNGVNNGVLLQQLLRPPIAIRRDQWEEVFDQIAILTTLLRR